ncbi:carboxylesterase 15-like [Phragmites australis]|uniref:carboxylesterase 15-like n=1 Tax=Phragmites australis TaxID=29695 RepID=UPI002D78415C|nr:carboxylesterase 15-like [Phragmites australis]
MMLSGENDHAWRREYGAYARVCLGRRQEEAPVVVYFHSSSSCISSYVWSIFHVASTKLTVGLGTIVLSTNYHLVSEHRLPATINVTVMVLLWLHDEAGADPWLAEVADVSRVFIACESAGGVLAHHMKVHFSGASTALQQSPDGAEDELLVGQRPSSRWDSTMHDGRVGWWRPVEVVAWVLGWRRKEIPCAGT